MREGRGHFIINHLLDRKRYPYDFRVIINIWHNFYLGEITVAFLVLSVLTELHFISSHLGSVQPCNVIVIGHLF